jgi:hypothetical protein
VIVYALTMSFHPKQENTYAEFFGLTDEDKELIAKLTDPIPFHEEKRITVLRQTKLLDSDGAEPTFDRFTSLGQRLFGVGDAFFEGSSGCYRSF